MPVAILRDHASVLDSWLVTRPQSLTCSVPPTEQEAIEKLGVTCDSPLNSYSAGKKLQDVAKQWKEEATGCGQAMERSTA
jgi:sphingomyelin phosphodiesterase 2